MNTISKFLLFVVGGAAIGMMAETPVFGRASVHDTTPVEAMDLGSDGGTAEAMCPPGCQAICQSRYDACQTRAGRDSDYCFHQLQVCRDGSPPGGSHSE